MANCSVCGAAMVHFENPSRDMCPRNHAKIEADERQRASGKGDKKVQERSEDQRGRPVKGVKGFQSRSKKDK